MQKFNTRITHLIINALLINALVFTAGTIKAQCRELAWSDEFEEDGLPNPSKWWYSTGGGGFGNNELQYYTSERSKNARVENGSLIIEAHKEAFSTNNYTSAKLNSKYSLKHGRVEMRAMLPKGRGTWAAMWMLPNNWNYGNLGWPDNGEIDIMEYVGFEPNIVHASVHTDAYNWANNNVRTNYTSVAGVETGYHIYALEWSETRMNFYVDNTKYLSYANDGSGWSKWPFDKDFYLILNLAIGGNWGGQNGVDNTIFPTRYVIDYVRMYRDPADFLPIAGPTKVFKDETYIYSVPSYAGTTYDWVLPANATAMSRIDSHAVKVKWDATGGNLKVNIIKSCDAFTRSVDVNVYDPLVQLPFDGTAWPIPGKVEAENFDTGGNGIAYYDKSTGNNGQATVRAGEDVDIDNGNDMGTSAHLGWIDTGEWMEYTVNVASDGFYDFNFRVATVNSGGRLHVEIDNVDVTGSVLIPNTGNWQTWVTKTVQSKALTSGQHLMRVVIESGDFDLNYIDVSSSLISGITNGKAGYMPVTLSPNPAQSTVNFSLALSSSENLLVTMTNTLGQVVYEKSYMNPANEFNADMDVSQLLPGTYVIRCVQAEKMFYNKLIVK
jgi:beta-glucanase (GH16 family)